MEWHGNFRRLNEMKLLIFEIAAGNFSYRLEPEDRQDETETVIALLNMMTDELKSLFHQINPEESTSYLVQASFLLNDRLEVIGASPEVLSFLDMNSSELSQTLFQDLLSGDSKKRFLQEIGSILSENTSFGLKLPLEFKAPNSLVVSADCSFQEMTVFPNERRIQVTVFKTVFRNKELEKILQDSVPSSKRSKGKEGKALRLESYRKLMQKLYLQILENLDKPLPTFDVLAQDIGASESKLRKGFKALYGDTVYNFHREKRFEKAAMLLQNTQQSIKQISMDCGFKSASHFSRKFKKRYGVKPSDLR